MVREELARRRVRDEDFRWRGEDVSRVEDFFDAVFAFAVTLLWSHSRCLEAIS